jgi:hypothetical protein
MKTLMTAVALILLSSCAGIQIHRDSYGDPVCGPPDFSNRSIPSIISNYWQRSYNTCQHEITVDYSIYKEHGIAQDTVKREEYCSCVAGKVRADIMANACADIIRSHDRAMTACMP